MSMMNGARYLPRASRAYHAAFRIASANARQPQRHIHLARPSPSPCLRKQFANTRIANHLRRESTAAQTTRAPNPLTEESTTSQQPSAEEIASRKAEQPAYDLHFTCRKCLHRSAHRVTKQAYHFGTTLVTCPGCKNRHLISDHLRIFGDKSVTVEEILKEKGELLRKGMLGQDGDVEFYEGPVAQSEKELAMGVGGEGRRGKDRE